MADTSIESAPLGTSDLFFGNGIWGPFWVSDQIGAIIFVNTNGDITARKTTDGGTTWNAQVVLEAESAVSLAAWFDQQTPGDTGDLIHIAYHADTAGTIRYANFDISGNAWSTPNAVGTLNPSATANSNIIAITKTRSGNVIVNAVTSAVGSVAAKAATPFNSWTNITSPFESNALDQVYGAVPNTGDNDDSALLFWDISANEISIKVYDNSANTWTETSIATGMAENTTWKQLTLTMRLSDGHILAGAWSQFDNAAADLRVFDIYADTVSAVKFVEKTNVLTNTDNAAMVDIFVDQISDDVYVAYGIGTNPTADLIINYKKSTDDMTTWGSQTLMQEDASDDHRLLHSGAMGNQSSGRYMPAWFDDDDLEIYVSTANDILINKPSVALNSPADAGTVATQTPTLDFTGSDPANTSLNYEIQIDTVNTFDSQTQSQVEEVITSDQWWTCPDGVYSVEIHTWGGGGGGRGEDGTQGGGGGGGGAYSKKNSFSVTPGQRYLAKVGAGGTGGASGVNGTAGGDTYFNSTATVLAKGGSGGVGGNATSAGGQATSGVGDTKTNGGTSGAGGGANGGGGGGSGGTGGNGGNGANGNGGAAAGGTAGSGTGGYPGFAGANGSSANGNGPSATSTNYGAGGGGAGDGGGAIGGNGAGGKIVLVYTPGRPLIDKVSGGASTTETFTADNTWTAPVGVNSVDVEVWGAGGGGGGSNGANPLGGAGGGGGAYSASTGISVTPFSSYTIEVGTGGSAGAATPTNGGTGGDSYFNTAGTVMAKGGGGGTANSTSAGSGGASGSSVGTTKNSGGNGGASALAGGGGGGGSAGSGSVGGTGGNAGVGAGGTAGTAGTGGGAAGGAGGSSALGNAGSAPGGGGGGSGGNAVGGAGRDGQVKVTYTPGDAGFDDPDSADTDPFTTGNNITYTLQSALSEGETYYWRVRARDPNGSNAWGPWSSTRSFTVQSGTTLTFTIDGLVKQILTATFTADGIVKAQTDKTFTIDGVVVLSATLKTDLWAMSFEEPLQTLTKTFTIDGIVKATTTNTFTIDGIVLAVTTNTFTIDGIVLATTTNTFTIDGVVLATTLNTFTIDGIVKAQTNNTFTIDGVVLVITTATFTIDGIVQAQTLNTFTIDGIVLATTTNTFTIDGIVKAQTDETFTIDGIVQAQTTNTFTIDGIVFATNTATFTADGIVKVLNNEKTFTIDGIVFATNTLTFTIDGIIFASNTLTFTIDGIVFATILSTFTIDGIVKEINSEVFSIDGIVLAVTTKTFTIDGIVLAVTTQTFTIDGIIFATNTATFTIDGIVLATTNNTFTIDAIVKVLNNEETFTIDGIVFAENTATFTIDGIIFATNTATFTIDGIVISGTEFTFTIDGIVKTLNNENTFTIDGIVQALTTATFTIDGIVLVQATSTFTIDGIVRAETTSIFTIDGIVKVEGNSNTFTIDGIIFAQNQATITIDGIVRAETTNTFTIDGIVRETQSESFTIDGLVSAGTDLTFTIDGLVLAQTNAIFTIDGIVKTLANEVTFTFDGIVKTLTNPVTFTIDGIIFATNSATFTIDGVVISGTTLEFTIDGIIQEQFTTTLTVDGIVKQIIGKKYGLQFDGIQNYVSLGTLGNLGSQLGNGFYCKFTIKTISTSRGFFGIVNSGTKVETTIVLNGNKNLSGASGYLAFLLRDNLGTVLRGGTLNTTNFNDGVKHTIEFLQIAGQNTFSILVDGVAQTIDYHTQNTPSSFINFEYNFVIGARNLRGVVDSFFACTLDNFQIGTSASNLYGNYELDEGFTRRNLILNPSIEDASNWGLNSGFVISAEDYYLGSQSIKQDTLSTYRNAWTNYLITVKSNTVYRVSFYYKLSTSSNGKVDFKVSLGGGSNPFAGNITSKGQLTAQADWTKVSVLLDTGSNTSIGIILTNLGGQVVAFYDAFVIEEANSLDSYFDGSLDGYAWEGTANASVSVIKTLDISGNLNHGLLVKSSGDYPLWVLEPNSFTIDGIILVVTSKTFTIDAIVKVTQEVTFTIDGIIEELKEVLFTLDGIVKEINTLSFTIDGIVKEIKILLVGNSLQFVGDQGYVGILNTPILAGQVDATVAVQFSANNQLKGNGGALYAERSSPGTGIFELRITPDSDINRGKIQFLYRDDNNILQRIYGTTDLSDAIIHKAVLVKRGTSIKIFVDGILDVDTTTNVSDDLSDPTFVVRIGDDNAGTQFNGIIADVQIYKKAVSDTEAILYSGNELLSSDPASYWKLDEGTGITVFDSSDNGIDGTLGGSPLPTWLLGPNELTIDAIVKEINTEIISIDGIVQAQTTNTFTIDGIVKTENTLTFTTDGIVKEINSVIFTFDAIIEEVNTATFTTDAIVKAQTNLEFTIDARIASTPFGSPGGKGREGLYHSDEAPRRLHSGVPTIYDHEDIPTLYNKNNEFLEGF